MIFIQGIYTFPTYPLMLLSIGLTLATLMDFKRIIESPSSINILTLPVFWFNVGTLVFYSVTFFIFSLINSGIIFMPKLVSWFIGLSNVFMYSCYGLSIHFDINRSRDL
jgi:hypothetical protein